jgi:hypothetical protein
MYKGMELIQSAKARIDNEQREQILSESLGLFNGILKDIRMDQLRDITESFKSLKYYLGIVDLVLKYAALEDVSALMTESVRIFGSKSIGLS